MTSNIIIGLYELDEFDKHELEEYLKAIGVAPLMRKVVIGHPSKTRIDIYLNGEEWAIKTSYGMRNHQINFKLGVEFDEYLLDGRISKSTITQEGPNKLLHVQKFDNMVNHNVWKFHETHLKLSLSPPGMVHKQIYARCEARNSSPEKAPNLHREMSANHNHQAQ